jgi:hypothetical protein
MQRLLVVEEECNLTVTKSKYDNQTFDSINQTLTEDLSADRPSLDNDPSVKKTSAFAATTASRYSLSEEHILVLEKIS